MRKLWQVSNLLFAALFLFGAALQYNDPDPVRWMAIYVAAAVTCVVVAVRRLEWQIPAAVGLIAAIWAGIYAWHGAWSVPFGEMFAEWEMKNQEVLETREMFGLCIIATWMAVVAIASGRMRHRNNEAAMQRATD